MMYKSALNRSIINDRTEHPERLNATLERIEEVVEIVLGDKADAIIEKCKKGIKHERDFLTEAEGEKIAAVLRLNCSIGEIKQITEMLQDSEISTDEAISLHEQFKIPVSHLEKDIVPVRGDGAWIIDTKGKMFLDMDSNYSATNLGMCNPEIAKGIYNQANQLISMKEDRVHIPRARFLKSLEKMMPSGLTQFYWQNSGGEAVDKALKIAKAYTGNKGVVAMKGGFHGRTHAAVSVTHELKYRKPFYLDNEDWVYFVDFNDADAVEKLFVEGKAKTVILELVQGEEAGIRPADKDFPKHLRKICDKNGGVMIADEIQSGFGRTAKKKGDWFTSMVYGIVPDIMTIGKSFGGGYPITAVVTNKDISSAMQSGYDGSTFGGNPMAMVAAMIATRQMWENDITSNVIIRSEQILNGLQSLKEKHDIVGEIRGLGLMIAFELPSADIVAAFQKEMAKNGVKTSLSTREWVRFLPLLIISEAEVEHLLKAIDLSLTAVQ
ncbi:MAG: aminotransferase class III-fold pyridoxal phosphate-dependent enzyme [candidate division Zixibacteria bacterium]|nr:aminotransferase class III-fold pyridoxal phosphate-dependent enzyme [candidate division Zixibacteria bacterium]